MAMTAERTGLRAGAAASLERANARRRHLTTRANPSRGLDYVVTFQGRLAPSERGPSVALRIRYVPDRLVLERDSVETYLGAVSEQDWSCLEEIAAALLSDLNNELVPRWLHVALDARREEGVGVVEHRVVLEDSQPGWRDSAPQARFGPS